MARRSGEKSAFKTFQSSVVMCIQLSGIGLTVRTRADRQSPTLFMEKWRMTSKDIGFL